MGYDVVIIGGGNAGLSVASRLARKRLRIAVVEPADAHFYQPMWTLVGAGLVSAEATRRRESAVMPAGADWIRASAVQVSPDRSAVVLDDGSEISFETLVLCPGIQLNWDGIPGLAAAVEGPHASSNYRYDLAPKTAEKIRAMRSGDALFSAPPGPVKCGGAPQKIAYLAADHWRRTGVDKDISITMVLPAAAIFSVKPFADTLTQVAARYGIRVLLERELTRIDADARTVTFAHADGEETLAYDFAHFVPPQSAPDWVRESPLAAPGDPRGYVDVDPGTLQHLRFPNVFAIGDVAALPTSKTGAAIRKQAPVLVTNLLAFLGGRPLSASYDGYTCCPLTTARGKVVLAEFTYGDAPAPSFPGIDTTKERLDMWVLKRYLLPFLYWNAILPGRM
ncbi:MULTISPECIES: NAD(P)/FAD-dependent oxidoreductase [Bacteria]|uniref:NAD(P)/FAD-dependent oxidoreductase n=1 Tax=Bacteria TaxID=2 RepID=UPI003C7E47EB